MTFKVIVAGSRDYDDWLYFENKLDHLLQNRTDIEIVCGGCDIPGICTYVREDGTKVYGADGMAERYGFERGVPVTIFAADWDKYGRYAGPIRNGNMAIYLAPKIDACVIFNLNNSRGSANMESHAQKRELQLRVYHIKKNPA